MNSIGSVWLYLSESIIIKTFFKHDLPGAMSISEVTDQMNMHSICNYAWYFEPLCATNGNGLYEGLDWLSSELKNK